MASELTSAGALSTVHSRFVTPGCRETGALSYHVTNPDEGRANGAALHAGVT